MSNIDLISLCVSRKNVKAVKSALEIHDLLDKTSKIKRVQHPSSSDMEDPQQEKYELRARVQNCGQADCSSGKTTTTESLDNMLKLLDLPADISEDVQLNQVHLAADSNQPGSGCSCNADFMSQPKSRNPIGTALTRWRELLPPEALYFVDDDTSNFFSVVSGSYSIYPPMLLLPSSPFQHPQWQNIQSNLPQHHLDTLWHLIATETNTTHIAINAPIPLHTTTATNTLRSPTNLTPLHGPFGPAPPIPSPTPPDFSSALWVTHRQNGIAQTWAPRHTMFSRGNIREKTRLLGLPSIQRCAGRFSAVDLFCGIGYFAFSYARAGARCVLGWEVNGWSVEGMRRGVEVNGWVGEVVREEEEGVESVLQRVGEGEGKAVLVVFHESNVRAVERIGLLRGCIPPVRHVNLGLLPSAEGAWDVAVRALDPELGGWLHVHENIALKEPEYGKRVQHIVAEIWKLAKIHQKKIVEGDSGVDAEIVVQLERVEHVKTYAPGVMHCVLDIFIGKEEE